MTPRTTINTRPHRAPMKHIRIAAIGCRTDTPPEEGRCNASLPHPLPKIAK